MSENELCQLSIAVVNIAFVIVILFAVSGLLILRLNKTSKDILKWKLRFSNVWGCLIAVLAIVIICSCLIRFSIWIIK